ncbi:GNAT family N-acetyltransferase [Streptomyces sp. ST1020]|uniref:GNAT family N-acetyltransferase n=1 Tax=Streptomyces sp. ST1020 TaxID=1848901 RepID=UPI0013A69250|nr:GNAT family N-acetyltransferase [Streptomyces sp. ST1020]
MEIRGAGRLKVRITAADVGKRVSVRRISDPAVTEGKFTDTVGVLTSWDDDVVVITRRDGIAVRIPTTSLVAGKVVPPAPARRRVPATSYEELSRVAARSWLPVESAPLGDWELRAAAGFTRRANSALPLGNPGVPLDEALRVVREWYGVRGLPAYIQVGDGDALCGELEARGWVREVTARVMVGGLAALADREVRAEVTLSREAGAAWLGRYQRKGVSDVALRVLGSGASVWFATVGGAGRGAVGGAGPDAAGSGVGDAGADASGSGAGGGAGHAGAGVPGSGAGGASRGGGESVVAIGRCVVDGRWAGFSAVEVDPGRRREGLGTDVMAVLAGRALAEGASAAWLQVEADNAGALALYEGLGFAVHHSYHHYREPA